MDAQWSDVHRGVMQAFMRSNSQTFTAAQFDQLVQELCVAVDEEYNAHQLTQFVGRLRAELDTLGMDVRKSHCHASGKMFYALVNCHADAAIQSQGATTLATDLSATQLTVYTRWLNAMAISGTDDENGDSEDDFVPRWTLGINYATILASTGDPQMSARDSQQLIKRLCQQQWLFRLGIDGLHVKMKGRLTLGPRAVLELESYLQDQTDVCRHCHKSVTFGYRCPNDECKQALHVYCASLLYKPDTGDCKCGECGTTIKGVELVEVERSNYNNANSNSPLKKEPAAKNSVAGERAGRNAAKRVDTEDVDEDEQDEDVEEEPAVRAPKRKPRKH